MVKQILHIQSSIFGDQGVSSTIASKLVQKLVDSTAADVTFRPVGVEEFPHYTAGTIAAVTAGKADLADILIDEVQAADIIVLGVPMYNFGIPSQLKSWFDHIARAGVTFKYTESGPVGLLQNKKAYVVSSRGGYHQGTATDVETPYMRTMLNFLGISDVEFIYAEGLNLSGEGKVKSIAQAEKQVEDLVA